MGTGMTEGGGIMIRGKKISPCGRNDRGRLKWQRESVSGEDC
jgi:hypothetical protein